MDDSDEPIKHPLINEIFSGKKDQVILSLQIKKPLVNFNTFNQNKDKALFIKIINTLVKEFKHSLLLSPSELLIKVI